MDYKKTNAPLNTVTRDLIEMSEQTGNIYETVCVVSKRANQIAVEMKKDLEKKLNAELCLATTFFQVVILTHITTKLKKFKN
jgi:hypothetical protein